MQTLRNILPGRPRTCAAALCLTMTKLRALPQCTLRLRSAARGDLLLEVLDVAEQFEAAVREVGAAILQTAQPLRCTGFSVLPRLLGACVCVWVTVCRHVIHRLERPTFGRSGIMPRFLPSVLVGVSHIVSSLLTPRLAKRAERVRVLEIAARPLLHHNVVLLIFHVHPSRARGIRLPQHGARHEALRWRLRQWRTRRTRAKRRRKRRMEINRLRTRTTSIWGGGRALRRPRGGTRHDAVR